MKTKTIYQQSALLSKVHLAIVFMNTILKYSLLIVLFCFCEITTSKCIAQDTLPFIKPTKADTLNGSITKERAWWDIQRYDLTIAPNFHNKQLFGKNTITYHTVGQKFKPVMQIDLVAPLKIDSVIQRGVKIPFKQVGNFWYLTFKTKQQPKQNQVTIYFSGHPTESVKPPWDGGLVWSKDALGRPWMSVACQYKGASLWYPCKNALYDEPDMGASISVIVADTLKAIANGRLLREVKMTNQQVMYTWNVNSPINHYGISFYIGNYIQINDVYQGKNGRLTMDYWILDYHRQKAELHLIPEARKTMEALEYWYGPYPFYKDGFKIVDAPYIGMEHQSAIAYGSSYMKGTNLKGGDISNTGWGQKTDKIVVHEMAHEWFGNSITANDIADRWIQEGFAGLAEGLVIEYFWGKPAGTAFLAGRFRTIENDQPIIARYGINEDGSADNYMKGWAVLQMVRSIIDDDEKFRKILIGLNQLYYCKVIASKDIEAYLSKNVQFNLKPFFDQYLRCNQVPVLEYYTEGNQLFYRYIDCIASFTLPVKTNYTGNAFIHPTTKWQSINIKDGVSNLPLKVDDQYYLKTQKSYMPKL